MFAGSMWSFLSVLLLVSSFLVVKATTIPTTENYPSPTNTLQLQYSTAITPMKRLLTFPNDELLNWEAPRSLQESFPWYVSGFDDDGRPIIVFEIGKYNYKEVLAKGGKNVQDAIKFTDQTIYRVEKWADADPDGPGEVVLIYDFDGFELSHVGSVEVTRYTLETMSKFKPLQARVGYGYFINANFLASGLINAMRPFLGAFMEKFETYGTRKEVWMPKLLRRLPKSQLAPWYGGTKRDFKPVVMYG